MRRTATLLVPLVILALAATACGPGEQVVRLTGNDQMKFDKSEIRVPAGAPVRIEFENVGKMPKEAMGHNLVILKAGVQAMEFGAKVAGMGAEGGFTIENEYLPPESRDQALHFTKVIGPGEKTTLQFKAPEPGVYEYVCTFPGHFAQMRGKLIIE